MDQMDTDQKATSYIDHSGRVVAVIHGLDAWWISARDRRRVKSKMLPPRRTREEAQADLDRYAKERGWEPEMYMETQ